MLKNLLSGPFKKDRNKLETELDHQQMTKMPYANTILWDRFNIIKETPYENTVMNLKLNRIINKLPKCAQSNELENTASLHTHFLKNKLA